MTDLLFVVITVAFFAGAALFVRFCDSLLDDEPLERSEPDGKNTGADADAPALAGSATGGGR